MKAALKLGIEERVGEGLLQVVHIKGQVTLEEVGGPRVLGGGLFGRVASGTEWWGSRAPWAENAAVGLWGLEGHRVRWV